MLASTSRALSSAVTAGVRRRVPWLHSNYCTATTTTWVNGERRTAAAHNVSVVGKKRAPQQHGWSIAPAAGAMAYHTTPASQSTTILIGGLGAGAALMGIKYAGQAYTQWQKNRPKQSKGSNTWSKRFYDGGFEEEMTRREAALILGVRETSSRDRVREAHRGLMLLNHPDKGGSIFLTAKINEAKDKLSVKKESPPPPPYFILFFPCNVFICRRSFHQLSLQAGIGRPDLIWRRGSWRVCEGITLFERGKQTGYGTRPRVHNRIDPGCVHGWVILYQMVVGYPRGTAAVESVQKVRGIPTNSFCHLRIFIIASTSPIYRVSIPGGCFFFFYCLTL